jgi:hypothetical protein
MAFGSTLDGLVTRSTAGSGVAHGRLDIVSHLGGRSPDQLSGSTSLKDVITADARAPLDARAFPRSRFSDALDIVQSAP